MKRLLLVGMLATGCEESGAAPPGTGPDGPRGGEDGPTLPGGPGWPGPIDAGASGSEIADGGPGGAADAAPPDSGAPDAGPPLPDLALLVPQMAASVAITWEGFAADHCAVQECLDAPGMRRLLRFATAAANVGAADLVLGDPQPAEPEWDYDACHQHYHFLSFARYELVTSDQQVLAVGRKQSFCLRDDQQVTPGAPSSGYDCTYQGLSAGWADIYGASLDCQFIDITAVAPGDYLLRVELNPDGVIEEESSANNVALIPVAIP